jgi:glycosyltransferase involved in cell wall biosynthesis
MNLTQVCRKTSSISGGYRDVEVNKDLNEPAALVSVITVVLNGQSTIACCIESVLAQTYKNVEHIIVDGGSTDHTVQILKSYNEKIAFWISEQDAGIYNAINKAVNLARGKYYIHLGSDDVLHPNGIDALYRYSSKNLLIAGKVRYVNKDKTLKGLIYNHAAGMLINVKLHEILGMYDESYRIAADTKFIQMAERASYILKIEETIGDFTFGGASSNYRQNVKEHARAMYEAGTWSAVKVFLWRTPRLLYSFLIRYLWLTVRT